MEVISMEMVIIALAGLFFVGMGTGFLPAFWRGFWPAFRASARASFIASRQASEQGARELRAQLGKADFHYPTTSGWHWQSPAGPAKAKSKIFRRLTVHI